MTVYTILKHRIQVRYDLKCPFIALWLEVGALLVRPLSLRCCFSCLLMKLIVNYAILVQEISKYAHMIYSAFILHICFTARPTKRKMQQLPESTTFQRSQHNSNLQTTKPTKSNLLVLVSKGEVAQVNNQQTSQLVLKKKSLVRPQQDTRGRYMIACRTQMLLSPTCLIMQPSLNIVVEF